MLKIKEKESYKAVMKKAFIKKVINNIIFFWLASFITMGLLIMVFGGVKIDKDIIKTLEKLNKEKEPKRESAVAEYIKGLLQKERG